MGRPKASGRRLEAGGWRLENSESGFGSHPIPFATRRSLFVTPRFHFSSFLPFDVGCSDVLMFDVLPQISPRSPSQRCRFAPGFRLGPGASGLRPPASVFPSMLDVLMFDVRCSAANLARVTISTMSHQASPGSRLGPGACSLRPAASVLPFDVGCSDVLMFDVLPQISHRVTISTMSLGPGFRLGPAA